MAIREIRLYGDPVLRKRCKALRQITAEDRQLAEDLMETMFDANGMGLAAPQIGVLKRIIAVRLDEDTATVVVNPKVSRREPPIESRVEGCLSLPGLQGNVRRHQTVVVVGRDINGRPIELEGDEVVAQAFCHEIEHLDGKLYIDKVEEGSLQWIRWERNEETGEEEAVLTPTTLAEVKEHFGVKGR